MAGTTSSEARGTWEAAAPGWAKWEEVLHRGYLDATREPLDMADVREGATVLELACGAGASA